MFLIPYILVLYGLSYLLGWSAVLAFATCGATFLIYSR